ncbi:hypothetical protein HDU76_007346, partial [Blyttiomyces sp. JEL0837]
VGRRPGNFSNVRKVKEVSDSGESDLPLALRDLRRSKTWGVERVGRRVRAGGVIVGHGRGRSRSGRDENGAGEDEDDVTLKPRSKSLTVWNRKNDEPLINFMPLISSRNPSVSTQLVKEAESPQQIESPVTSPPSTPAPPPYPVTQHKPLRAAKSTGNLHPRRAATVSSPPTVAHPVGMNRILSLLPSNMNFGESADIFAQRAMWDTQVQTVQIDQANAGMQGLGQGRELREYQEIIASLQLQMYVAGAQGSRNAEEVAGGNGDGDGEGRDGNGDDSYSENVPLGERRLERRVSAPTVVKVSVELRRSWSFVRKESGVRRRRGDGNYGGDGAIGGLNKEGGAKITEIPDAPLDSVAPESLAVLADTNVKAIEASPALVKSVANDDGSVKVKASEEKEVVDESDKGESTVRGRRSRASSPVRKRRSSVFVSMFGRRKSASLSTVSRASASASDDATMVGVDGESIAADATRDLDQDGKTQVTTRPISLAGNGLHTTAVIPSIVTEDVSVSTNVNSTESDTQGSSESKRKEKRTSWWGSSRSSSRGPVQHDDVTLTGNDDVKDELTAKLTVKDDRKKRKEKHQSLLSPHVATEKSGWWKSLKRAKTVRQETVSKDAGLTVDNTKDAKLLDKGVNGFENAVSEVVEPANQTQPVVTVVTTTTTSPPSTSSLLTPGKLEGNGLSNLQGLDDLGRSGSANSDDRDSGWFGSLTKRSIRGRGVGMGSKAALSHGGLSIQQQQQQNSSYHPATVFNLKRNGSSESIASVKITNGQAQAQDPSVITNINTISNPPLIQTDSITSSNNPSVPSPKLVPRSVVNRRQLGVLSPNMNPGGGSFSASNAGSIVSAPLRRPSGGDGSVDSVGVAVGQGLPVSSLPTVAASGPVSVGTSTKEVVAVEEGGVHEKKGLLGMGFSGGRKGKGAGKGLGLGLFGGGKDVGKGAGVKTVAIKRLG